MKLVSITFESAPKLPGIRPGDLCTINCDRPDGAMRGWRVMIRGAAIFFVSPAGFQTNVSPMAWDKTKPPIVHEVPRANCYLQWSGPSSPADIDTLVKSKYDSEPLGEPFEVVVPEAPKSILAQLDPSQMGDA